MTNAGVIILDVNSYKGKTNKAQVLCTCKRVLN